ncbi:MAG: hypothetical protein CVV24_11525 [Ignavibacteriae bacterium HGW-Ignavibacteriae-3]|nr:MAG: hypothetical protein CVV24_11525 [Ignavibacteriae bacterium HGW-Ignavibacteriae-3]
MRIKLFIAISAVFLFSCTKDAIRENSSIDQNPGPNERLAQAFFIDGSIAEMKGLYNDAINHYLEAAKFDKQPGILYSLAKNYYRINKLSKALYYARKAVDNDSTNIDFLSLQATIYSTAHMPDSAETLYHKIVKLDSSNVTAYYNLAQISEPKMPNVALSYYKKILELVGPEWNVLVKIAEINERLGNVDTTIGTVEELLNMNPSDLQLQKLLMESYIKAGKYENALKLIEESLISYPDDPNLIEMKGNVLIQKGEWKKASYEYIKLVKSSDISFENKIRIGTAFYLQAERDPVNYDLASEIFKTINIDTVDWQVNAYLGEIEVRKGRDSSAIEYFKVAAELAEWNNQIWVRLGGLLFDTRRYKESIIYMSKAFEKFPNDFAVNLIYGLSLSSDNDHVSAKEALQRALNLNPDDLTALSAMGFTMNQLKEDDKALKFLNKALALDSKNIQVISIIAMIHESRKDYAVSDSLYTEAIKIDSTDVLILNNYAYSLAERGISLEEALSMSKKAVESEPTNSSYLDTIGWIYYRLGEYKKARSYIEDAIKIEDKNATLIDHLGDVNFKLGNKTKAMDLWKKAFELDSTKTEIKNKIIKGDL